MGKPNVSSVCAELNATDVRTALQLAHKLNQDFFEGKLSAIIVSELEEGKFLATLAVDDDTANIKHDEYLTDNT